MRHGAAAPYPLAHTPTMIYHKQSCIAIITADGTTELQTSSKTADHSHLQAQRFTAHHDTFQVIVEEGFTKHDSQPRPKCLCILRETQLSTFQTNHRSPTSACPAHANQPPSPILLTRITTHIRLHTPGLQDVASMPNSTCLGSS